MAEVLCVYREVQLLKQSALAQEGEMAAVAIVSFDEKTGVQAIGTTAPDHRTLCHILDAPDELRAAIPGGYQFKSVAKGHPERNRQ